MDPMAEAAIVILQHSLAVRVQFSICIFTIDLRWSQLSSEMLFPLFFFLNWTTIDR